jgi:hypothetical protein
MKRNKVIVLAMWAFLIFITNGCASGPKIKSQRPNDRISIQTLQKNWESYDVYYSGYSVSNSTGILFDPKDNVTKLGGNRWTKIEDHVTLSKVIETLPKFTYPDKIEGPNGEIYGYIYYLKREPRGVRSQRAVISMADANTIIINFESISTGNGLVRTQR